MRAEGCKQANLVNQSGKDTTHGAKGGRHSDACDRKQETGASVTGKDRENTKDRECLMILSINLMTLNLMSSIIRYCNDSKRVGEMVKPLMQ